MADIGDMALRRIGLLLAFLALATASLLAGAVNAGASAEVTSMAVASTASGVNLSGSWVTSPAGTSLVIKQQGATITWTGGPDNKAWIQEFTGKLTGDVFSGVFRQDEPGRTPQRYGGTLSAKVINTCAFKTLHVI